MNTRFFVLLLCALLTIFAGTPLFAQSSSITGQPAERNIEELAAEAQEAIDLARQAQLDLLSPRHFQRAEDAWKEARSLMERSRDDDLIRIKLKLSADELEAARQNAEKARTLLADVLAARTSAQTVGADTLSAVLWKKTEERMRGLIHDVERAGGTVKPEEVSDVAGAYRASRRDALRIGILSQARGQVDDLEKRGGDRIVPVLVLRAQQAISRAEADLAQENLDSARSEAQAALRSVTHANALINYINAAQKTKQPWESALLPYDDILMKIAEHLGESLDMSKGGAYAGPQLLAMIDARQESLAVQVVDQKKTLIDMEAALAEAQTTVADAQNRIAELEKRLQSLEGERNTARASAQKGSETADRVARAQDLFKPGEATVFQNSDGSVTIRLTGILFKPNATKLDKTHQRIIGTAATAIGQFPGATIRVEGHTDSEGPEEANLTLSATRAQSVATYLASQLKLKTDQIKAVGLGESRPIADNDKAEGRVRNRRIDIVLVLP